jgi:Anti-sigma-K factor rskA
MSTCAICRDEVDALESAIDALPLLVPQVQPSPALRRRVMTEVRADARAQRKPAPTLRRRLAKPMPRPALAGFAALMVAAILTVGLTLEPSSTRDVRAAVAWAPGGAVVSVTGSRAVLYVKGMPAPPAGKVYEVWVERGSGAPKATTALFDPTTAGGEAAVDVPGNLSDVTTVLVTAERSGGSQVPHGSKLVVAKLS